VPRGKQSRNRKRSRRCRQLLALLSEYLDKRLKSGDCDALERHIRGCPLCRAFVASLKESVAACRQCRPDRLDPAVAARTRARLLAACSIWQQSVPRGTLRKTGSRRAKNPPQPLSNRELAAS
jgi:anti-sigma factor RsiW